MPRVVPTGRTENEIVEVPPDRLDCGHPIGPLKVTIGYGPLPAGGRARVYRCNECGVDTWDQPEP